MGIRANLLNIQMTTSGFNYNRNFELVAEEALIDPSVNYNLHNLGVEKRGGTSIVQAKIITSQVMGGTDFRQTSGTQNLVYAKKNGKIYANNDSNEIATGMSVSNFFHFSQFYDELYVADGAVTPKKWTGGGTMTSVTPASDWAVTGNPFQIIFHPRGASFRNWAITKNGVYASKADTPDDFNDSDVIYIPIYSKGGLVGAFEFGEELFVCSKTETFRIDDSSTDVAEWGYRKAIWEGGVAHWRLIVQGNNDIFLMTDDLNIYSLSGVFETGDYRKASLSRPAQIDRYLREKATFANLENWHAAYDPKLRCIKWFIQVGGSGNNTALVQFLDREAEKSWAIHDNDTYDSGYKATCSFTYRKSISDWRIRTGDTSGNIWELEQAARADNGNPIPSRLKWKPWQFGNALMHKHFPKGVFRIRSSTNMTFTVYIWVDNMRLPDIILSVSGSGAVFDAAFFDAAFFSDDAISRTPFDIKSFGSTLQIQINHDGLNEDFFLAEMIMLFKEEGLRVFALTT